MAFSQSQLEGRALEHEFAKQTGYGIHMCSFEGAWTWVRGGQAREIRKHMRSKVTELQPELEMQGLFVQAADCRVRVDDENHSLDLRVYIPEKQTDALFEMKWTRQSLDVSLAQARQSYKWMRKACQRGRWVLRTGKVDKPIQASAVGAIAVGPKGWKAEAKCWQGSWSHVFSFSEEGCCETDHEKTKEWRAELGELEGWRQAWRPQVLASCSIWGAQARCAQEASSTGMTPAADENAPARRFFF